MKQLLMSCAAAAVLVAASPAAQAAGNADSVETVRFAGDYMLSAAELVGQDVLNARGEKIATVNDILVTREEHAIFAVLSVGGFLGIGERLVAVPYEKLKIGEDSVTMPGTSQEDLASMDEFSYREGAWDRFARQRYMSRMERSIDDWSMRIDDAYEKSKDKAQESAGALGEELSESWEKTQEEFRELKRATGREWEEARRAFERSMNDFRKRWDKATK